MEQEKRQDAAKVVVFPFLGRNIIIHLSGILAAILFAILYAADRDGAVARWIYLSLMILFSVLTIVSFLYSNIWGWNAPVHLSKEGVWQRKGRKIREWRWEEFVDIQCPTHRSWFFRFSFYAPKMTLLSAEPGKRLTIVFERYVREKFLTVCTNEMLSQKYVLLLSRCDYRYL